jgi:hypothetical protein
MTLLTEGDIDWGGGSCEADSFVEFHRKCENLE